jgi:hypothetical protein
MAFAASLESVAASNILGDMNAISVNSLLLVSSRRN